jgi:uncharacterized protein YjiS (DUF1127 family)
MLNLTAALFPGLQLDRRHPNGGLLALVRERIRYHRAMRELNQLSDRTLDDIDVAREEFPTLAWRHAKGLPPRDRS